MDDVSYQPVQLLGHSAKIPGLPRWLAELHCTSLCAFASFLDVCTSFRNGTMFITLATHLRWPGMLHRLRCDMSKPPLEAKGYSRNSNAHSAASLFICWTSRIYRILFACSGLNTK